MKNRRLWKALCAALLCVALLCGAFAVSAEELTDIELDLGSDAIGTGANEFVLDLVSGSAHTGTGGVPSLDHEFLDDPVEDDAVIETFLGQFDEVARGYGHVIVHLEFDIAYVRVKNYESHDGR